MTHTSMTSPSEEEVDETYVFSFWPDTDMQTEYEAKLDRANAAQTKMDAAIRAAEVALHTPSWQFAGGTHDRAAVITQAIEAIYAYDQERASLSGSIETGLRRKKLFAKIK